MPCHIIPCHASACQYMPVHAISCHTMPYHAVPCVMPCYPVLCHVHAMPPQRDSSESFCLGTTWNYRLLRFPFDLKSKRKFFSTNLCSIFQVRRPSVFHLWTNLPCLQQVISPIAIKVIICIMLTQPRSRDIRVRRAREKSTTTSVLTVKRLFCTNQNCFFTR